MSSSEQRSTGHPTAQPAEERAMPRTKTPETRLGHLAVERGVITREELENALARRGRPGSKHAEERIGEKLLREHLVTLELLDELIQEQRRRRDQQTRGPGAGVRLGADGLGQALASLRDKGATELLALPGRPRALRIRGHLVPAEEAPMTREAVLALAGEVFPPEDVAALAAGRTQTRLVECPAGRFRATLSPVEGGPSLALRALNLEVEAHAEKLPAEVSALADLKRGLVVIGGGHGATRAAVLGQLVDMINRTSRRHVITMERQISFQHESKESLVAQREVGRHTASYATALRAALREDPDVLVVGDLWDPDAVATALLAAETGHLVICAIHATTPVQAIRRLVDVQGDQRRSLVRASLASTLQAAVVIDVIPGKDGERFVVADVVPGSAAVVRLIREDRLHQLETMSEASSGVTSRDERITWLHGAGRISRELALERMRDPARLDAARPT